eukprot:m.74806 g.74806  ORF g.74806 m.74806 type:complete len:311 (-) comp14536_c0_seq1:3-935(-)
MAHGADGEEVLLVAVAETHALLKELARGHAGRADNNVLVVEEADELLDGTLAVERELVRGRDQLVLDKGLALDQEGVRALRGLQVLLCRLQRLLGTLDVIGEHLERHADGGEHGRGGLALDHVLRLVLLAGLATPANHDEHGDPVNLGVGQRHDGVDNVAEARVLQVHERNLLGGQVVAGGQRDGCTLVGGDDVLVGRAVGRDVGAEVLEEGVWDAAEKVDADVAEGLEEACRLDEVADQLGHRRIGLGLACNGGRLVALGLGICGHSGCARGCHDGRAGKGGDRADGESAGAEHGCCGWRDPEHTHTHK